MSIHEIKVIKIDSIEPHPNADRLELIKIWEYTCVVSKGQFKIGDLAVYIEPDYMVDTVRPQFQFLAKKEEMGGISVTSYGKKRITVRRFRGVWSSGLLVEAPTGAKEGDNVMDQLGITRYEPAESNLVKSAGGSGLGSSAVVKGPKFHCPHYDLNNIRKYAKVLEPKELVLLTAKIHGTNGRFCYSDGQMFCGSRNTWKKKPGYYFRNKPKNFFVALVLLVLMFISRSNAEKAFNLMMSLPFKWMRRFNPQFTYYVGDNAWWKAFEQNPWILDFCKSNPNWVLYGEVYGPGIQGKNFHYGLKDDEVGFAVFDVLEPKYEYDPNSDKTKIVAHKWVNNSRIMFEDGFKILKTVPFLYQGPFDMQVISELAEKKETFNKAGHVREGVVVKLVNEREDANIGRVALKYVSNTYLEKE